MGSGTGQFNIALNERYSEIDMKVFDLSGAMVLEEQFQNQQEVTINLEQFPAGIYFTEVSTDAWKQTVKLIVQ